MTRRGGNPYAKFRWEGYVDSTPNPINLPSNIYDDKSFIMLVRDIQFQDIKSNAYKGFNSLYDVAKKNGGNYIEVNNNYQNIQDPPNPDLINHLRKKR